MPWHVARDDRCPPDRPFAVIADADGSVVGCYPTEGDANDRVTELYAAEPDAAPSTAAAEPEHACSCQTRTDLVLAHVPARSAATVATAPFDQPFPTPEYPPAEWFEGPPTWIEEWRAEHGFGPSLDADTGILHLTVTDEGRVGAYFYDRGACIIHDHNACPKPSPTGYAAFHQQAVVLDNGQTMLAGVIGNTHGHASPWVDYVQAQRHYADPSAQMIVCRAGDDERGGWIAGALVPGLTFGDVAMLRRCALSGDWRPMPATWWAAHNIPPSVVAAVDGFDAIGPTLVTRPALPLMSAYVASLDGHATAILGGGGGVQLAAAGSLPDDVRALAQEIATGQSRNGIDAGPILTLLNRAVAYLNGGDAAKARDALVEAVDVAADLEEDAPGLKGLADRVRALADAAKGAAVGSMFDPDPDGTVRFAQEVPTGMRRTLLHPDGSIEILDSTPSEDAEREQAVAVAASLVAALDLPLAPLDRAWDPDGATTRLLRNATGDDGAVDPARHASAYLWREPGDDPVVYRFPIADVIDGELVAVPAAIAAAAAEIEEMPPVARAALRANLDAYYARIAAEHGDAAPRAPWTAAPEDEGMMPGEHPEDGAPAEITAAMWDEMNARVAALEEFASAVIEAQMASAVKADGAELGDVLADAAAQVAATAAEFPAIEEPAPATV